MGRTACTELQCLYKGALYLSLFLSHLFQFITQCFDATIQVTDSVVKYGYMYRVVNTLFSDANTIRIVVLVTLLIGTYDIQSLRFGRKPCLEHRTTNRKYSYKWQA